MRDDFLSPDELAALGLGEVGVRVRISRHALLFRTERIRIGDESRIDAFCVLSAGKSLVIGRHVHISTHTVVLGGGAVEIGDFATISARCSIFSSNDDYSGETMTNPTVPADLRGVTSEQVIVGPHAIVGAGSVILPGATVGESAAVGALSLVKVDVAPFAIVAGTPARVIGERRRGHRTLASRVT